MGLERYWLKCLSEEKGSSSCRAENGNLDNSRWRRNPARELSGKERTVLKQRAHHLKPIVQIGQNGVTDNIIREIRRQLSIHELIKVKWSSLSKEDGNKKEQARELARKVGAHFIHLIGHNIVLYNKRNTEQT